MQNNKALKQFLIKSDKGKMKIGYWNSKKLVDLEQPIKD